MGNQTHKLGSRYCYHNMITTKRILSPVGYSYLFITTAFGLITLLFYKSVALRFQKQIKFFLSHFILAA